MDNDERELTSGDRVVAFRGNLWSRGKAAELCWEPATIVRRYGALISKVTPWRYPDLCDLVFDSDNEESRAHFTSSLKSSNPFSQEQP